MLRGIERFRASGVLKKSLKKFRKAFEKSKNAAKFLLHSVRHQMSGLKVLEKSWKKFRKAFDKRQINAKLSFYVTSSAGS